MKLNLDYKKIWGEVITASLIIIISGIAIISFIQISNQGVDIYNPSEKIETSKGVDTISEVLGLVQTKNIEKIEIDKLVQGAIEGILEELDDPYARYLTKEEYEEMISSGHEIYSGIGIHISINTTTEEIVIIGVMPDSPAKEAGLKAGDVILKVEGTSATIENYIESVNNIKGEIGTKVSLEIKSDGKVKTYEIERKEIIANNITSEILEGNIGYIKIFEFSNDIYEDFKNEYDELIENDKIESLIIDVRNNPGGAVTDTVKIVDLLTKSGDILKMVNGDGTTKIYTSDSRQIEIPLVVLINENSASASEILAGAIKDLDQGTLIGKKTFGKGIVQSIIKLDSGEGAISITTAKYYTALGNEIHEVGILPDIEVDLAEGTELSLVTDLNKDSQLKKAIEFLKEQM